MTDDLAPRAERRAAPRPEAGPVGDPIADPAPPLPTEPADVALLGLIDRLAALLDRSELTELEVQMGGTGLVLRKPVAIEVPTVAAAGAAAAASGGAGAADATPSGGSSASSTARPSVKAPLTGIWYGSPTPGSSPYVVEGGEVAVGQVVGLIEAMKLFNEIKSDLAGRVTKIRAESGKLVKAKQALIEVDPL
jgi:acetyl-CoA carboxylase biotin carboxyl carrier protein